MFTSIVFRAYTSVGNTRAGIFANGVVAGRRLLNSSSIFNWKPLALRIFISLKEGRSLGDGEKGGKEGRSSRKWGGIDRKHYPHPYIQFLRFFSFSAYALFFSLRLLRQMSHAPIKNNGGTHTGLPSCPLAPSNE